MIYIDAHTGMPLVIEVVFSIAMISWIASIGGVLVGRGWGGEP